MISLEIFWFLKLFDLAIGVLRATKLVIFFELPNLSGQ